MKKYILLVAMVLTTSLIARPDSHAPIGVMADHAHKQGELMISYRYMFMNMNQNYAGSKTESTDDMVAPNGAYFVAPTQMTMQMHMAGLMFAPIDAITIMAMVPFTANEMNHTIAATPAASIGVSEFTTKSSGLGDVQLAALHPLIHANKHQVLLGLGVSLATGSVEKQDAIPLPAPTQGRTLPYPMQLGSGTTDLKPSAGYTFMGSGFSAGLQAKATFRLGNNKRSYRFGNELTLNTWFSYSVTTWLSTSLRGQWRSVLDIKGADATISQTAPNGTNLSVPTAQPGIRASDRLDVFLGFNLYTEAGFGLDQRLAFEVGLPAYQRLDGQNLGTNLQINVGYQSLIADFY